MYVIDNAHLAGGITPAGIAWAFRSSYACNWHPLTWLSHMLDQQLFGAGPGPQHLVNILLHTANSVLLFLALLRMTRRPWPSATVAALFAWHPAHVESVAWIAERKDVLSGFFFFPHFARVRAPLRAPERAPLRICRALFRARTHGQADARDASVCIAAARLLAAGTPSRAGATAASRSGKNSTLRVVGQFVY